MRRPTDTVPRRSCRQQKDKKDTREARTPPFIVREGGEQGERSVIVREGWSRGRRPSLKRPCMAVGWLAMSRLAGAGHLIFCRRRDSDGYRGYPSGAGHGAGQREDRSLAENAGRASHEGRAASRDRDR